MEKNPFTRAKENIKRIVKKGTVIGMVVATPFMGSAKGVAATSEHDALKQPIAPVTAKAPVQKSEAAEGTVSYEEAQKTAEISKMEMIRMLEEDLKDKENEYNEEVSAFMGNASNASKHLSAEGHEKEAKHFTNATVSLVVSIEKALNQFVQENPGKDLTKHTKEIAEIVLNMNNQVTGADILEISNIINHANIASVEMIPATRELGHGNVASTHVPGKQLGAMMYFQTAPRDVLSAYLKFAQAKQKLAEAQIESDMTASIK
jgi:hypothetical protein